MAVRWGLIVEESVGYRYSRYRPRVLAEVTGTREEALAELARQVEEYVDGYGYDGPRRRLFRTDDGFLYVRGKNYATTGARFSVAELLSDSDDAKAAEAARRKAAKERKAAERKPRRGWWSQADEADPAEYEDGYAPGEPEDRPGAPGQ
ncbi:hypothetical protein [Actinacidiphila epipremni]|jgi:hypothetical protein|uniref:Uncharacterized protein n=1 Tax=Actinacidiphila epipremni TaxID=2053013 RepID=A0ABX0ZFD3_9ACTN|nr:hypothetical protein [Actinacidiphila epipremni]NJP42513.1 hypothetical protein [Actinacidiphila epipremni]